MTQSTPGQCTTAESAHLRVRQGGWAAGEGGRHHRKQQRIHFRRRQLGGGRGDKLNGGRPHAVDKGTEDARLPRCGAAEHRDLLKQVCSQVHLYAMLHALLLQGGRQTGTKVAMGALLQVQHYLIAW